MDPAAIASIISLVAGGIDQAIKVGPIVIKSFNDARPFLTFLFEQLMGRKATEDELTQLEAQMDALDAQFQQPLPPAQEDDV